MFKQKRFLSCSKGFARFGINVSGGVHLQKSCRSQVFNFTKDRLHRVVHLGIWKIFRIAILWRSAVSYFHYYVMSQSFFFFYQSQEFFSFYLFGWRHWERTSNLLSNNISLEICIYIFEYIYLSIYAFKFSPQTMRKKFDVFWFIYRGQSVAQALKQPKDLKFDSNSPSI